jgi:hypothetical protein
MWRSVILIFALRAGLTTCLAMLATNALTVRREWLMAGGTWVTPALA